MDSRINDLLNIFITIMWLNFRNVESGDKFEFTIYGFGAMMENIDSETGGQSE